MKNLICCRPNDSGGKMYVLHEPQGNKLNTFPSETALLNWRGKNKDVYVEGLNFTDGAVNVVDEPLYCKDKVYVVAMLGEDRKAQGKKPKIVGYRIYVPAYGTCKCYPISDGIALAKYYGAVNAEISEYMGTEFLKVRAKIEPAKKHAGLYLRLYHIRKEKAQAAGRPCEKIVRVDEQHLELRSVPAGEFDRMVTPAGVNFINLKYWKLLNNVDMQFSERPKVNSLTLGTNVLEIKYNEPENDRDLVPKSVSLGAFACWGLKDVSLNKELKVIGREAFKGNQLKKVFIPAAVTEIGEEAFANNPLTELSFGACTEKVKHSIRIGKGAFKGAQFDDYTVLKLPPITYLGPDAFNSNAKLQSILFAGKYTNIKFFAPGVFANTAIDEMWVPDSVEVIAPGAFKGTPIKKLIFTKNSKIKHIYREAFDKPNEVKLVGVGDDKWVTERTIKVPRYDYETGERRFKGFTTPYTQNSNSSNKKPVAKPNNRGTKK